MNIKMIIKIVITLSLMLYLLSKIPIEDLKSIIQFARLEYLFLVLSIIFTGVFISVLKWKLLISAKSLNIPYSELLEFYFIGMFFNSFMPSSIGGDIFKGHEVSKKYGNHIFIFSSIFIERFTGLIALIFWSVIGFLLGSSLLFSLNIAFILLFVTGMVVILTLALYDIKYIKKFRHLYAPILLRFDYFKLKNKVEQLHTSINDYKNHKSIIYKSIILSILFQFLSIMTHYFIALALNIHINIIYFFMFVPLIIFVSLIPISIYGLGVRESAYVFFFTKVGLTNSEAFAIPIVGLFILLVVNFIGGIVYLNYSMGNKKR